jgi:hypothetical protein
MSQHVMLDLETFSSKKNGLIISIGAVVFDPFGTALGDTFHVGIDLKERPQVNALFDVDAETVGCWWFDPARDEARKAWWDLPKVDLGSALAAFAMWYGEDKTVPVWGNGVDFDNVLLRNAYETMGLECPWGFRASRCYRTLKALAPNIEATGMSGVAHNALADAMWQAQHLQKIMAHSWNGAITAFTHGAGEL